MLSTHVVLAESQDQQIGEEISNPTFHQGALTSVFGVEFTANVKYTDRASTMGSYNTHNNLLEMHCLALRYSLRCCVFIGVLRSRLYVPSSAVEDSNNKPPSAAAFSFSGNHSLVCCCCCCLLSTVNLHLLSVHYLHCSYGKLQIYFL